MPVHISIINLTLMDDSSDIGEPLVDLGAYCLMQNHFHLLLRQWTETVLVNLCKTNHRLYDVFQ